LDASLYSTESFKDLQSIFPPPPGDRELTNEEQSEVWRQRKSGSRVLKICEEMRAIYMADPVDIQKKRNERIKQEILNRLLSNKQSEVEVAHFDPYVVLYDKATQTIQIFRFEEAVARKIFQDSPKSDAKKNDGNE
jgi:hypothetical protein